MNAATLAMALEYVGRGWSVFPLRPRTKRPATPHGFKDATRDTRMVRNWFDNDAGFNIGIATGAPSGVFAIDVDPRHAGDETLGALERRFGRLPETPRALTGGADGGQHILFCQPEGVKLAGSLGDGVEVKSDGGYIVAAPSVHPDSGRVYRWDVGALPSETPIAVAPAWLLDALGKDARPPLQPIDGADAADTVLGRAFELAGLLGDPLPGGKRIVLCPWADGHSDGRGRGADSSTVILPPTTPAKWGAFRCLHAHCAGKRFEDVMAVFPIDVAREARTKYRRLDGGTPAPAADTPELRPGPSANSAPSAKRVWTPAQRIAVWRKDGALVHEPTGLATLDDLTGGGPVYGSRWYVLGAPDAGKTGLVAQLADTWSRHGVVVGMLAIDEEPDDITTRFAQRAGISRGQCETRDEHTLAELEGALAPCDRVRLFDSEWTIEEAAADLAAEAARLGENRIALFVDSIQTATCDAVRTATRADRELTERSAVTANVRALRSVATRHRLIAVATSEMNRGAYRTVASADEQSDMVGAKESGAIEYSARVMLSLRNAPGGANVIAVRIPKNKHGPSSIGADAFYLTMDRGLQTLAIADAPPAKAGNEEARTAKGKKQIAADAAKLALLLLDFPGGIGVNQARSQLKSRHGSFSKDRLGPAIVKLGDGIAPRSTDPGKASPMFLLGRGVPEDVLAELSSEQRERVASSEPGTITQPRKARKRARKKPSPGSHP
jgi:KaiC/GvpD/RAD55 family RecA-like ATPase